MGNCCSQSSSKPVPGKYRQYIQNTRYAGVNQSPLQWRRADNIGSSKHDCEDESDRESETAAPLFGGEKKNSHINGDMNVNADQECLIDNSVRNSKKCNDQLQQKPIEITICAQPKKQSTTPILDKKGSECSSFTSHSSIQESSDADTKNLIERSKEEISVKPKNNRTQDTMTDDIVDGVKEIDPIQALHTCTESSELDEADSKYITGTEETIIYKQNSSTDKLDMSKCNSLPSKYKNKLPHVIKREKKSVEELIEAFKNEDSLIRAPCKEYLSDNLFEEAKLQHHQVLVSTLLPNFSANTSFSSGKEQSTFDIADVDPENKHKTKKYQHFQSMDSLPLCEPKNSSSTPKADSRVKHSQTCSQVKLFDIGAFEDSVDEGNNVAKSQMSLSSISHSSGRKISCNNDSYQYESDTNISIGFNLNHSNESHRTPENFQFQNSFLNDSWNRNQFKDDDKDKTGSQKNSMNDSIVFSQKNEIDVQDISCDAGNNCGNVNINDSRDNSPTKMFKSNSMNSGNDNTPIKTRESQSSVASPERNRKSSTKSYQLASYSPASQKDYVDSDNGKKSKENSLNISGDRGSRNAAADKCDSDKNDSDNDEYFAFITKRSQPDIDYDDIFCRSKMTRRSPEKPKSTQSSINYDEIFGISKMTRRSPSTPKVAAAGLKKSSAFEDFTNLEGSYEDKTRHSRESFYLNNDEEDTDDFDSDFGGKFSGLNHGTSPKCRRKISYNFHDAEDFGTYRNDENKNDNSFEFNSHVDDNKENDTNKSEDECTSFQLNKHVKVSKKGLTFEALGCELNVGKKVQLSLFKGKKSMLI